MNVSYHSPGVGLDDSRGEPYPNDKKLALVNHSILPVLSVPTQDLHSATSKLFECSIVSEKNKFVMYYKRSDGSEIAVLRADKQQTLKVIPKYHIFDISQVEGGSVVPLEKSANEYLGKIRRDKDIRYHSFALHSEREEVLTVLPRKVMHVLFTVPPLAKSFMGKERPRKTQVALYHEASDVSERGNTLSERVASSMRETSLLASVSDPDAGLITFTNKEPYKKGDVYALNFFGRCQLSNPGNTQMEDDKGNVVLQVAQLDDGRFSCDFRSPFTPFTAFAFAICQFADY